MNRKNFRYLKEGDTVTRMLAGLIPIKLEVTRVTDDIVYCGVWDFSRDTGYEIDEYILGLVSFLIHDEEIN